MSGESGRKRPHNNTMNNTKRNTQPMKNSNSLKGKKIPDVDRHELFVQWLILLLRDDQGRAVIRAMVEQNEMPVIDRAYGDRQTRPQS